MLFLFSRASGRWWQSVIYLYSILNSAPNFHSYFTLQCFQCLPIPYSNVFLFHTPTFPTFPTVFWRLSALWCFPYSNISKILLFHSIPSPCSDVFRCFPYFYRCGTFSELLWTRYHHGTFLVTSQTHFLKHHNLKSIMDSLLHNLLYSTLYLLLHRYLSPLV